MAESLPECLVRQGFKLIETQISQVFLGGQDLYKVKRAVDLGFLDFTTLALRERACAAEVLLNRRLAPHVYHGVVAVVRERDNRIAFLARAELGNRSVLEWAVHMTLLPDRERLAAPTLTGTRWEALAGRQAVPVCGATPNALPV